MGFVTRGHVYPSNDATAMGSFRAAKAAMMGTSTTRTPVPMNVFRLVAEMVSFEPTSLQRTLLTKIASLPWRTSVFTAEMTV
jgi:hypothetical protein